jgi:mono/diheme cytochrome c family protein
MKDSTRNIIYGVLVGLPTMLVVWVFSLYFFGCGTTNTCTGIPQPDRTPVPTLLAATLPAPKVGAEAIAAKPRCQVAAVDLIGAWVNAGFPETATFNFTDLKSRNCTATFKEDVQQLFIESNRWYDGAPACITCHSSDVAKATKNMDLSSYAGIVAGSNRVGGAAKGTDILGGGDWSKALLHQMLYAPDGKTEINRPPMPLGRPATVPANGPVISAGTPAGAAETTALGTPETAATPTSVASAPTATAAAAPAVEVARPSNPGGPGEAVNQTGDPVAGGLLFNTNCVACHGEEGRGGIDNPGSTDGTVPPVNPIDPTLVDPDLKVFATNLDLFIQHGSTPAGPSPAKSMPAWGDTKALDQKQIADVIAFLIKINTATAPIENSPLDIARPSNPGGAGVAITLTGDPKTGEQLFVQNCAACHGPQGTSGIQNPGSTDGTVPALNPIDATIKSANPVVFAYNLDLFLEHGSKPEGPSPALQMPAWGDSGKLLPQQMADLIAYLISLNK